MKGMEDCVEHQRSRPKGCRSLNGRPSRTTLKPKSIKPSKQANTARRKKNQQNSSALLWALAPVC
jgi:hypothetical protein